MGQINIKHPIDDGQGKGISLSLLPDAAIVSLNCRDDLG
jgi:hypothetical protein